MKEIKTEIKEKGVEGGIKEFDPKILDYMVHISKKPIIIQQKKSVFKARTPPLPY